MKNTFKVFGIIVITAIIGFGITACPDPGGGPTGSGDPVVTDVIINGGSSRSAAPSGSITFTATVLGQNSPSQSVTWSITTTDKKAGTTINPTGKLQIAADEPLEKQLIIRATSTANTSKYGEVTVTVKEGGSVTFEGFAISGSFESQNEADSGLATFYASEVAQPPAPSPQVRSIARSAEPEESDEVVLEGLLEDGDITFRLRGSYNRTTKIYSLSAAASFLRYSIAGKLDEPESSGAVVQLRGSGGVWESFEIRVTVESTEQAPEIDSTNVEDDLDKGIPERMWGIWWGLDAKEKGKGDIVTPGNYYYVIDAYTIIEYVNRHGLWNKEGYTCFFEGADENGAGLVSGRVIFDYTNQALIDEEHPTWWIECVADYAKQEDGVAAYNKIMAVVNDPEGWRLWSDPYWKAMVEEYSSGAQHSGFTEYRWNTLFNKKPYSFPAYRKNAYRVNTSTGQLQMGTYYGSNNKYFDEVPGVVDSFTQLRWDSILYSRQASAAETAVVTSRIVTGKWKTLNIPAESNAVAHDNFKGKTEVLQVSSENWSIIEFPLTNRGRKVNISASMDIWLPYESSVLWQINQDGHPLVLGKEDTPYLSSQTNEGNGTWYNLTGNLNNVELRGNVLFLSRFQFGGNDIYIHNPTIAVTAVDSAPTPPSITGNLGSYSFPREWDEILMDFTDNYFYERAEWTLAGNKLGIAKANDAVLTFTFDDPLYNITLAWGADGDWENSWWNSVDIIANGAATMPGVTISGKTVTINIPAVLYNYNHFKTVSSAYISVIDWSIGNINFLKMTSANLTGTYTPPTPPTNITGNLGNYVFGSDGNDETVYSQAVWVPLSEANLALIKTSGAKLVLTLPQAPTSGMNLIWQGEADGWTWNDTPITANNGAILNKKAVWNDTDKTLTIKFADLTTNYEKFLSEISMKLTIYYNGGDSVNALGITKAEITAPAATPPLATITGNLSNYVFDTYHLADTYILYNRAKWVLMADQLTKAKANDAKVEFEFAQALTSLTLVWLGGTDGWNAADILTNGTPASGVTYANNKLTINLPAVLANYEDFKTADAASLVLIDWGIANFNSLEMTKAELSGTVPTAAVWTLTQEIADDTSEITITEGTEGDFTAYTISGELAEPSVEVEHPYVNARFEPDTATLTAMQAMTKLTFIVKGDGDFEVMIPTTETLTANNHYRKAFTATSTPTTITVNIPADLAQADWGGAGEAEFVKANIESLQFSKPTPGTFELKVWDIKLY